MSEIKKRYSETIAHQICDALKRNGMDAVYAPDTSSALQECLSRITPGDTIAVGGSVTLDEIGLIEVLRSGKAPQGSFTFYDQYKKGLSRDEALALRRRSLTADLFFSGTNAITLGGELVNVDGFGNRVAAISFGPQRVIIVAGVNKIVADIEAGLKRIETRAAPLNCQRLDRRTPCYKTGSCVDEECLGPERICNVYSVIKRQPRGNSITVILVGEELGY
jgi:L-lactate utilization protein LutB